MYTFVATKKGSCGISTYHDEANHPFISSYPYRTEYTFATEILKQIQQ
jgi:hypothetical protein